MAYNTVTHAVGGSAGTEGPGARAHFGWRLPRDLTYMGTQTLPWLTPGDTVSCGNLFPLTAKRSYSRSERLPWFLQSHLCTSSSFRFVQAFLMAF
ncbi:hypothetical protein BaRGS_00014304 [Batillaria attramentaria]|uniref:Uncharacterized protein n=1 Tax=Batillaria attramentaria TaxID=370345 RepID=A0ABD0L5Q9_9CAEN